MSWHGEFSADTQERILIKGTASAWTPKALWATTGTDIKGSQNETKAQLNAQQEQLNAQQELNAQRDDNLKGKEPIRTSRSALRR
ncbi:hypothetical protein NDU88_000961 [Pleurodeles waltl]|uniref:Uncharacterized protein n=1 Tax=Pleurodeles waltl TaxID=8319 RepID=A0AAV7Q8Q8_PLEWA|nr:hypothetical protein NDU88_000961 [Pleurodeles waltl]